jgi:epoxyqueuosine reductase
VAGLKQTLIEIGHAAGLDQVRFTTAEPFRQTHDHLVQRKREGLSARLGFTYGHPVEATDPGSSFPWARSLVVGARSYLPQSGSPQPIVAATGRVARVAVQDNYQPLRQALEAVADALADRGHRAMVLCDDNRLVDRAAAVRAGIGWWGKNTMVLSPGFGPWLLLGSVITEAELAPDSPLVRDCGSCSACLPACPTGALVAPGVLDARRCLAAWAQTPGMVPVEYRVAMGDRVYGCDECLEACPPGIRLWRSADSPRGRIDLSWMLWAADRDLLEKLGHWFIPDRQPDIIRRNALIAAGNSADARLVPVVAPYAAHPNWILRAHALWALRRLGGAMARAVIELRQPLESNPRVRAELA